MFLVTMIHWSWFKEDKFLFHKSSYIGQFQIEIYLARSQVKKAWKNIFLDLCLLKVFLFQHVFTRRF
jgi:hypothetical protein